MSIIDRSSQEKATPETLYASIPDSELYDSLVTETTPSSNTCQPFLPLDVSSILKPNSFDIAKIDEPEGELNLSFYGDLGVGWEERWWVNRLLKC